jgi:hypothetical protein
MTMAAQPRPCRQPRAHRPRRVRSVGAAVVEAVPPARRLQAWPQSAVHPRPVPSRPVPMTLRSQPLYSVPWPCCKAVEFRLCLERILATLPLHPCGPRSVAKPYCQTRARRRSAFGCKGAARSAAASAFAKDSSGARACGGIEGSRALAGAEEHAGLRRLRDVYARAAGHLTSAAPGMGLSSPSFDTSAKHSTWTT